MCGIIAVVRRPSERPRPEGDALVRTLSAAADELAAAADGVPEPSRLDAVGRSVADVDRQLRGAPGVGLLVADGTVVGELRHQARRLDAEIAAIEARLDSLEIDARAMTADAGIEAVNAALIRLKDAVWGIEHDRLRTGRAVRELAGADPTPSAVAAYLSIQQALSALDRLEVRGRDSAGLHVLVRGHGLELDGALGAELVRRSTDPLFGSGTVRGTDGSLGFVYKAAAEIGELGDNTRALRAAIADDELLRRAISAPGAQAVVLGHTRWASVGIISQPNAHPLNSDEIETGPGDGDGQPLDPAPSGSYVTAVLNGDVDNFADLKVAEGLRIPAEITTDAKVIPTLVARNRADGLPLVEAFRRCVDLLEGSVAIGASACDEPGDLLLALRGSGQALYVGLADDAFVVASEPYGLVEETDCYLRLDGETPADPEHPSTSRGQIVRLVGDQGGQLEGIERVSYDGTALPVAADELVTAQITTRDIDRGDAPHFLYKEICEAPASFRKTLRGKLVDDAGALQVVLPDEALPAALRADLAAGRIRRVVAIGQGTAAVAGQSLAAALTAALGDESPVRVKAMLATELSGFDLPADLSDALVVAISQSGTTTDTNRTVDLARARGARVVSIVNRRNSDLTDKSDGVLYTSDGRDVEMSVASTKAFYSQVAAGFLLALAIADEVGADPTYPRAEVLEGLRELPELMSRTLDLRPTIAEAASRFAPSRRYWAVVGNGPNRIAANEVRIKLSELCYKSIACDSTEDKKHIDLSSEPLIIVCAAGLSGSTADDVAKEVAIYRAHKAAPVVIASKGDERFSAALQAVLVPQTHPNLAFVLSAMAGHLFSYEAALAIDAQARPLREARAAIESVVSDDVDGDLLDRLARQLVPPASAYFDALRGGDYDGHLEASTAVRLASLLRYALGTSPLEAYQVEHGKVGTPSVVVEDLTLALTRAIEELTRPIDAIKHQAKTVTVGISRSDESLLQVPLVAEVLGTGVARDQLTYSALRTLATLDPAVAEVLGYTRYRIEGSVDDDRHPATSVVIDRGGISRELVSRTETHPELVGTKHRVAVQRLVTVARGRRDGRTLVIVPEIKDKQPVGLTLLHLRFHEHLPPAAMRAVLTGYQGRFSALKDAVTETEPTFRDDLLGQIPVIDLLTEPVYVLADRWRAGSA
jgi:glucosamine--fructose-6-phosphate aminotransferase (isomerizing)